MHIYEYLYICRERETEKEDRGRKRERMRERERRYQGIVTSAKRAHTEGLGRRLVTHPGFGVRVLGQGLGSGFGVRV